MKKDCTNSEGRHTIQRRFVSRLYVYSRLNDSHYPALFLFIPYA